MGLNVRDGGHNDERKLNFHRSSGRGFGNTFHRSMFVDNSSVERETFQGLEGPKIFGGGSRYNGGGKYPRRNPNRKYGAWNYNPQRKEIDLTKPWITEEIQNENKKKNEFLLSWTKSKNIEDWNKYKLQKIHLEKIHNKVKFEYLKRHPGESVLWEKSSNERSYCEACDKSFRTKDDLLVHKAEHETCNRDGCGFTAHPKIIAKHIKMQHDSGLFKRIGNLYTEEDIAKWIEERKKRYPTRKVVEAKKMLEEEKLKRGEKIKENDSKFNKSFNKNKGNRKRKFEKRTNREEKTIKTNRSRKKAKVRKLQKEIKEEEKEKEIEGSRKGVPAFMGIGNNKEKELKIKIDNNISDEEWEMSDESKSQRNGKPLLNNSLGLLAEFYNSDEDSDQEEPEKKMETEKASGDEESGPEEVKTISNKTPFEENLNENKVPSKRKFREKKEENERKKGNALNLFNVKVNKLTLLEKLLKKEIRHERNVILQCIHYVIRNNFLQ